MQTSPDIQKLALQFAAIADFDQKCAFFHANPCLSGVFRADLFPKPEPKPAVKITTDK